MFTVHTTINVKVLLIIHFETIYQFIKHKSMDKHIIGENAGILWRFLSTDAHKKWSLAEVKKGTGLDDMELASAIGWLAREDKIQFELQHSSGKDKIAYVYLMLNVYF